MPLLGLLRSSVRAPCYSYNKRSARLVVMGHWETISYLDSGKYSPFKTPPRTPLFSTTMPFERWCGGDNNGNGSASGRGCRRRETHVVAKREYNYW